MRIVNVMKAGVSPKFVGREFFNDLLQESASVAQLDLECTSFFISEILKGIGVQIDLPSEALEDIDGFQWPETIQQYSFPPPGFREANWEILQEFIDSLFECAAEKQTEYEASISANERGNAKEKSRNAQEQDATAVEMMLPTENTLNVDSTPRSDSDSSEKDIGDESPVEYMLELMAMWNCVRRSLEKAVSHNCFREPFARIYYILFMDSHLLGKLYKQQFPIMENMCLIFYRKALEALYFVSSHKMVVDGLLNLVERDFDLLAATSPDEFFKVFTEILTVRNVKASYIVVFKRLISLMEAQAHSEKLPLLIRSLTTQEMQTIYYNWLLRRVDSVKTVLLEYLHVLLKYISPVDTTFHDAVLNALLYNTAGPRQISKSAAQLYYKAMHGRWSDKRIFDHWVEFLLGRYRESLNLEPYTMAMWDSFGYLYELTRYTQLLRVPTYKDEVHLIYAHILVVLYTFYLQDVDTHRDQLQKILLELPLLLEETKAMRLRCILLKILQSTTFEVMRYLCSEETGQVIANMEISMGRILETSKDVSVVFITQLVQQFVRSIEYTKSWHRYKQFAAFLAKRYREFEENLQQCDANNKTPSDSLLGEYADTLKKLMVFLKTDYDEVGCLDYIFLILENRFVVSKCAYIGKYKEDIDGYAFDIMGFCLSKCLTWDRNDSAAFYTKLPGSLKRLASHLKEALSDFKSLTQKSLEQAESFYNTLLLLHIKFNKSQTSLYHLEIDSTTYHIIIQATILLCFHAEKFKNTRGSHKEDLSPDSLYGYQSLMLHHLAVLHCIDGVTIPNNTIWKVLIYYGQATHNLHEPMHKLLKVVALRHFDQYRNMLAVLIFNLYKQRPALKLITINEVICKHKLFIEREIPRHAELVKLHTVLTVLQIVFKALNVTEPKATENRLQVLSHLHILLDGVDLIAFNVQGDIIGELSKLEVNQLSAAEAKRLKLFKEYLAKQQFEAEMNNINDSVVVVTSNSNIIPAGNSNAKPTGNSNVTPAGNSNVTPAGNSNAKPTGNSNAKPTVNSNVTPACNSNVTSTGNTNLAINLTE